MSLAGGYAITDHYAANHNHKTDNTMTTENYDYEKAWEEVKKLDKDRLPKQALAKVREIRDHATKEKNHTQIIKTYIFGIDYAKEVEGSDEEMSRGYMEELRAFEQAANQMPADYNAISYNRIAHFYQAFLEGRRNSISRRTQLENDNSDDIETWGVERFQKEILKRYLSSIKDIENLSNKPSSQYDGLLKWSMPYRDSEGMTPTLYDHLALEAIRYIDGHSEESDFSLRKLELIKPYPEFVKYQPDNNDKESLENLRLSLYQNLVGIHANDNDKRVLLDMDLRRLRYYRDNSVNEMAEQEYYNTLIQMRELYKCNLGKDSEPIPDVPEGKICFLIAEQMINQGKRKEAHEFAESESKRFKDYNLNNVCHNLECKSLSFSTEQYIHSDVNFPILLSYANMGKVYVKVVQMKGEDQIYRDHRKMANIMNDCKTVWQGSFDIIDPKDYGDKTSELIIPKLACGYYGIMACTDSNYKPEKSEIIACQCIRVLDFAVIKNQNKDDRPIFMTLDRNTGKAIPGVALKITENKKKIYETVSGSNGEITVPASLFEKRNAWNTSLEFSHNGVATSMDGYCTNQTDFFDRADSSLTTKFFTDRKIYRPGQTVYWKCIIYGQYRNNANVCRNAKTKIALYDANSQKIAEQEICTNEFGSAHGKFEIPTGLSNGQFRIRDTKSMEGISFSVEEYKRPTFTVRINDPKDEVRINGKVAMTGHAETYAGQKLEGAKVRYTVKREPEWMGWWHWGGSQAEKLIAEAEATTDSNGDFSIEFTAEPNPADKESEFLAYNYRIEAGVTDINGETRYASNYIKVGYASLFLGSSLNRGLMIMEKNDLSKISVDAHTINGEPAEADIKVKISKLKNPEKPLLKKRWKSCDNPIYTRQQWEKEFPLLEYQTGDMSLDSLPVDSQIMTMNVHSGKEAAKVDLSELRKRGSGCYLIRLESTDSQQRPVSYETRVMLYSTADKITTINQNLIVCADKASYQPGDVAHIHVASALNNVILRYVATYQDGILEEKEIKLDASSQTIDIPIKESHRGGITLQCYMLKDNNIFTERLNLSVPFSNKDLSVKFETFRDCLYPGEGEKWKLKITDHEGKPAHAEMLATLYDESLDALEANSWYMSVYQSHFANEMYDIRLYGMDGSILTQTDDNQPKGYVNRQMDSRIEWFGHSPRYYRRYGMDNMMGARGRGIMFSKSAMMVDCAPMVCDDAMPEEAEPMMMMSMDRMDNGMDSEPQESEDFSNAEVRTNFSELAFFSPDIVTDENGELYIEFTVPESITKWKMMGLAHTQDMKYGDVQNHLITKKDFSVQPNMPRFLRTGDEIQIPVKISNLTDSQKLGGQVKMEILNATTMQPAKGFVIGNALQNFDVEPGKTISRTFGIKVPETPEPVIIKVVGVSGGKSDGEQHALPILTDRELVTEAMTLSVRGNQTRNFEFKSWKNNKSSTMQSHSFTLEYSSNPAWYAVTSLPWLTEQTYDNYDYITQKLFANSVSGLIIANNPDIDKMLKTWKEQNSQVLTSPLQKNQELKTVLMEETPWAIDARDENGRMIELNNLLDSRRIAGENAKLIKKLEEGQLSNGSWPWFAGMRPSPGMTQYIAVIMGKMRHMGVDMDSKIDKMMKKAMKYLDNEIVEYHKNCLKWKTEPGFYGYQYMYMRTFWPEYKMDNRTQEAYDFVMKHAKENWNKIGLHNQALLCTTFKRAGEMELAKKIIASFSDRAIHSDEFGMYYNDNVNGMLFHERNIETQAQIVEAYQEFKMTDEVEELKIWLIKNRQANRWKTAQATTEAVYAMFLCGNKIKCDEPLCRITLGGHNVDMSQAEAGTGYYKQQWDKDNLDISMADIKVENPNPHISYGAVYFQYFERLDKIVKADNKLKIDKQMFAIGRDAKGKEMLTEIKGNKQIRPGDKVRIRFVIKTDRDMDYVHLKDLRAAGFEPLNVISQTKYQDGMIYYESTKDASENFFIEHLNKGTYVFEYDLVAVHSGNFSNGIATIQCMYAPEFVAHSEGVRFVIKE